MRCGQNGHRRSPRNLTVRGHRVADERLQSFERSAVVSGRYERLRRERAVAVELPPRSGRMQQVDLRVDERAGKRRVDAIELDSGDVGVVTRHQTRERHVGARSAARHGHAGDPPVYFWNFGKRQSRKRFVRRRVHAQAARQRPETAGFVRPVEQISALEIAAFGVQPERIDGRRALGIERHQRRDARNAARRSRRAANVEVDIGSACGRIDQHRLVSQHFVEIREAVGRAGDVQSQQRMKVIADCERSANADLRAAVVRMQRQQRDDVVAIDDPALSESNGRLR